MRAAATVMDDFERAEKRWGLPKRKRNFALTLLGCVAAAAAITAVVGHAFAQILAPALVS